MLASNTLPSARNTHDTIFLVGLMTIMLVVVISFLLIEFLVSGEIGTSLNNTFSPQDPGIIEEQV